MPNLRLFARILLCFLTAGVVYLVFLLRGFPAGFRDAVAPILNFNNLTEDTCVEDQIIRVAVYPSGGFAPGILANGGLTTVPNSIYEKDEKIRVEFIVEEDPIRCFELLYNNRADLIWSNMWVLSRFYLKYRSIHPVAVMMYGFSSGEEIILARDLIKKFDTAMKLSIACVKGRAPHCLALVLLNENGIDHNSVRWHYTLSDKDAIVLFKKGKVSIAAVSSREKAGVGHAHPVISSSHAPALFPGIFLIREDVSLTKKPLVSKFISGWFKGLDEVKKNSDAAAKAIAASFGIDEKAAKYILNEYVLAGLKDNFEFFGLQNSKNINFDRSIELINYYYRVAIETLPPGMLRTTDVLNEFINQQKPSLRVEPAAPVLAETTLEKFIRDAKVTFKSGDYSLDIANAKTLEKFSEKAALFQNAKIFLYGDASSQETAVYNYAWGMRFYVIKKFLSDNGVSESRIVIKEIVHNPAHADDPDAVRCALVP